jgi:hypothetical protein
MNAPLSRSLWTILRLIVIAVLALGAAGAPVPALAKPPQYKSITPYDGTFVDNDHDTLDDAYEDQLMDKFAPLLKLSDCEDDYPASVDWYLDRTTLGWGPDEHDEHTQFSPVNTRANLISAAHTRILLVLPIHFFSGAMNQRMVGQDAFSETDYYLEVDYNDPNTSTYRGQRDSSVLDTSTNPATGKWPVYAHVRPTPGTGHGGMIDISYWFFYPHNGDLGTGHCGTGGGGEHEGDWEHITVRVAADGSSIHGVYFAVHSGGHWRGPGDFTSLWNTTTTGRHGPVVWTANHSHADYWDNGGDDENHTADSLYPDWTDGKGVQWETWHNLRNMGEKWYPRAGMEWIQYTGKWGELDEGGAAHPHGPTGPALKGNWDDSDGWMGLVDLHLKPEVTSPAKQFAAPNVSTTFNLGSFTDSSSTGPWIMSVNWGDGTTSNFNVTPGQAVQYAHTYTAWGDFTVRATVSNAATAGENSFTVGVWGSYEDIAQSGPSYTVNSTRGPTDNVCGVGHCTLAEAIQAANNDGVASTIELGAGQTYLVPESFNISSPVTINAHGAVIDAQLLTRPFWVNAGATLEINDATVRNGKVAWYGGAIYNQGTLILRRCTFMYNTAWVGGALINDGTASIGDTTFWNNGAWYGTQYERGGAIFNRGNLHLLNSTLAYNIGALEDGGANLYNQATAIVKNTILTSVDMNIAHNWSCGGTGMSSGSRNNLNTDYFSCFAATFANPNLGELDYYAGLTPHLPALPGPAIDAGNTVACQSNLLGGQDQRQYKRFADGNGDGYKYCDIGAHEYISQPGSSSAPAADTAAPLTRIRLTPASPDGTNSWYHGPVTVTLEAYDGDSGVIELRCALDPATAPTTYEELPEDICPFLAGAPVSDDGMHTLYMAAMDEAGNKSAVLSKGFKIDATPPVVTCPAAGPFLLHSGDQAVGPAGVDASVSGLDEAASTLSGIVATEAIGPKSLTFTAFDLAGNSAQKTCTYNVIYDFGGYYPPVAPVPAINPAAAGSAIPMKFSLAGDQGLDILAAGYPTVQQVDCQTTSQLIGDPSAIKPAGKSGLSYDPLTGWYNYVWKTDKAWVGTCRALTIQLSDGTRHVAYFRFQ